MNKKITALFIIISVLILIFVACTDMDPLGVAKGVPEGYNPGSSVVTGNWIYFAQQTDGAMTTDIKRMTLTGTGVETVFTVDYLDVKKIQIDSVNQKVYILEHFAATVNKILEYNLIDGSGEALVVDKGSGSDISDITIDVIHEHLYYLFTNGIDRVDISNSTHSISNIYTQDITLYAYVALDYADPATIYYQSKDVNNINRVDTPSTVTQPFGTTYAPQAGLCYDTRDSVLYYYDYNGIVIRKSDGSLRDVGGNGFTGNLVLDLDNRKIFYYDSKGIDKRLYSINMDLGSDTPQEIYQFSSNISGFDIFTDPN